MKIVNYSKFDGENSSITMLRDNKKKKTFFIQVFMHINRLKMIVYVVSQRYDTYEF